MIAIDKRRTLNVSSTLPDDLRIAVITPCHNTPQAWLDQCRQSVLAQTLPLYAHPGQ